MTLLEANLETTFSPLFRDLQFTCAVLCLFKVQAQRHVSLVELKAAW